ncbi:MAG: hypothetical protein WCQ48_09025, partial [Chloroflexota bacterium]
MRMYIECTQAADGDVTVVAPVGYYSAATKTGHACALLVHIRGEDAIVAVADTGETALECRQLEYDEYDGERAIVAMRRTDRKSACGVLEFARNVSPLLGARDELVAAREAILAACAPVPDWSYADDEPHDVCEDRHLAVQVINSDRGAIISHPQRSGTCTFYGTLWLLGIADALEDDPECANRVLGDAAGGDQALILARIGHIDKEIKKLGFARLLAGLHPEIAELVASDYSGCAWLDTKGLRATLAAQRARDEQFEPVVACAVTQVRTSILTQGRATSLWELAAWVHAHGRAFGSGERVLETATMAAFAYVARDVLVRPVDFKDVTEGSTEHVLVVARYAFHVRDAWDLPCHVDAAIGWSMRCVRYAACIVRKRHGLAAGRSARTAMPATFGTSLPWAAAEYHALQDETAAVAHLLFHSENVAALSALEHRPANRAKILSTNEFHAAWHAATSAGVAAREARTAALVASLESATGDDVHRINAAIAAARSRPRRARRGSAPRAPL